MKYSLFRFYDIRPGEGARAILLFSYIFLIIASLTAIKPVRNSLFLTRFGASQLPFLYMIVAVTSVAVASGYTALTRRLKLNLLIWMTTIGSIGCFLLFWVLLKRPFPPAVLIYSFYIWITVFGIIATSQVWLLANYVFNAREARRIFAFIGAGAILGGIFGGYLTNFLAHRLGTIHLILISITLLSVCLVLLRVVWKKGTRLNYREKRARHEATEEKKESPIRLILKSRHLTYLAGVIGLGVVVANLVDYQFNAIVSDRIKNQDQLTAFFGLWLSNLSVASFLVQLMFTGKIVTKWGVRASLFFLPVAILAGELAVLIQGGLIAAVLIKISDGGLKHSINKAGLELLILPVPSSIKNQAKGFIDLFVDSMATGVGGVLLLLFGASQGLAVERIAVLALVLIAIWIFLVIRVQREYVHSFRTAIERRTLRPEEKTTNLQDASTVESLIRILEGNHEKQILYVLSLLENSINQRLVPSLRKLLSHPSSEVKIQTLLLLTDHMKEDCSIEAKRLLGDPDFEVITEALSYLSKRSRNKQELLSQFLNQPDIRLQVAALLTAAGLYGSDKTFRSTFPLEDYWDQILERTKAEENPEFKEILARSVGISRQHQLYPHLTELLQDPSPEVRKSAIWAAGKTGDKSFLPVLIDSLSDKVLRKDAREAISQLGEAVLPILNNRLNTQNEKRNIRLNIPRVISKIGSQKSADLLLWHLDQKDLMLRYEVIRALNKLRVTYGLNFPKKFIEMKVAEETQNYYQMLTILLRENGSQKDSIATTPARRLLVRALSERLDDNLERIFRLLGLRYRPQDMLMAYKGLRAESADLRANAVEFLDNVLDPGLKKQLLPIVEVSSMQMLAEKMQDDLGLRIPTETECLTAILEGEDNWLKACALHLIAQENMERNVTLLKHLAEDSDPVVRESAVYSLSRGNGQGGDQRC